MRDTALWHPFSDMAKVRHSEVVISRGEGIWLWDEDGNRYIDGAGSLWYAQIGHGRQEIIDAVAAQMQQIETYSCFTEIATPPARELAQRLSDRAPMEDAKVFLVTGGGEAIDTAAKLSRLYWDVMGKSDRLHIVSRTHGYHGAHGFGTSIGGMPPNRQGFGPLIADTTQVPYDSVDALERKISEIGSENIASFFFEPVIGAGGVLPPPEGYVEAVTELCQSLGILVVADAVICGFGRLGSWFGVERFGIKPDMITFAKGVTSGYLPVGGVVVSGRVAEPFWSDPGRVAFRHGPTYAGHAACCAAGLANMEIMEREGLVTRGQELENILLESLEPLADHELVSEVRGGVGLLAAVDLDPRILEHVPGAPNLLGAHVREAGTITRPSLRGVPVSPPLIISPEEIDQIAESIKNGLDAFARTEVVQGALAAA